MSGTRAGHSCTDRIRRRTTGRRVALAVLLPADLLVFAATLAIPVFLIVLVVMARRSDAAEPTRPPEEPAAGQREERDKHQS